MSAAPRRLLLQLLLPLLVRGALDSQPESCPRRLDCTLQRREACPPGLHTCGPCLAQFEEDGHGRCVPRKQAPRGRTSVPNVEGEIDFLADVLSRQEDANLRLAQSAPAGQHAKAKAEAAQRGRAGPSPTTTRSPPHTEAVKSLPVEPAPMTSNDALILGKWLAARWDWLRSAFRWIPNLASHVARPQ
ncbi:hypothetical protein lerEdw1_015895 [Lerista edwardsae]|nr:hypothetical protein lerEdw1_015895 [Lerista edwardsae]